MRTTTSKQQHDPVASALAAFPSRDRAVHDAHWAKVVRPGAWRHHPAVRSSIRRGTQADARTAADLWLRARKRALGAIPPPAHDDDDVRDWFASHVVTDTELWLALDASGTCVGILVLDGAWVDQLYVEPTMTGQGIGTNLLSFAKRQRPQGLRLWTFASNTRAQRFYEHHGFAETDRTDGRGNEERAPDILYAWPADGRPRRGGDRGCAASISARGDAPLRAMWASGS